MTACFASSSLRPLRSLAAHPNSPMSLPFNLGSFQKVERAQANQKKNTASVNK